MVEHTIADPGVSSLILNQLNLHDWRYVQGFIDRSLNFILALPGTRPLGREGGRPGSAGDYT